MKVSFSMRSYKRVPEDSILHYFPIENFAINCYQIRKKLRVTLNLLKRSLMENVIFFKVAALNIDRFRICVIVYSINFRAPISLSGKFKRLQVNDIMGHCGILMYQVC